MPLCFAWTIEGTLQRREKNNKYDHLIVVLRVFVSAIHRTRFLVGMSDNVRISTLENMSSLLTYAARIFKRGVGKKFPFLLLLARRRRRFIVSCY